MSRFVARGAKLAARKVAGEMVILAAEDSNIFILNAVGTTIWEAADGRTSIDAIADAMSLEYEIDPATARHDIEEFVAALAEAGVLSVSDEAMP